ALSELIAATDPARRLDRIAERAEPVDVTAERARRHAEAVGQLGPGPVAAGLQQAEQGKGAGSGVGHGSEDFSYCGRKLTAILGTLGDVGNELRPVPRRHR